MLSTREVVVAVVGLLVHDRALDDEAVEHQPRPAEEHLDEVDVERLEPSVDLLPLELVEHPVPLAEGADDVREVAAPLPRHPERAEGVVGRAVQPRVVAVDEVVPVAGEEEALGLVIDQNRPA